MSKQESIKIEGEVIEALGNSIFRVKLHNNAIVTAHISGKIRMNNIRILAGDKVELEISPYCLEKGRISKRLPRAES